LIKQLKIFQVNATLHTSISETNDISNNKSAHESNKHIKQVREKLNEYEPISRRHLHPHM